MLLLVGSKLTRFTKEKVPDHIRRPIFSKNKKLMKSKMMILWKSNWKQEEAIKRKIQKKVEETKNSINLHHRFYQPKKYYPTKTLLQNLH